MKNSCKKKSAFILSLIFAASGTGYQLFSCNIPAVNSANVSTGTAQADSSYYDAAAKTLHLKGCVRNSGTGVILPEGVKRDEVEHIVAEKGAVLPENCSHFCGGLTSLSSADFRNADTSNVTDMSYMFMPVDDEGFALKEIDVGGFKTSKVTSMKGMFKWSADPDLDLSSFDTSNVTDMSEMFEYCLYTKHVDISSFDTSNVSDMSHMFSNCWKLRSLDVSGLNTSKVTDMSYMFYFSYIDCLDLSDFDTSKVTNMMWMFGGATIGSFDVGNFDTGNVTNMRGMFAHYKHEAPPDLSSFNTSKVKDMSQMFGCCSNIKTLDLSSFDTSNVNDMTCMFYDCGSLETIYVGSRWSTANVGGGRISEAYGIPNDSDMFTDCPKLKGSAGTVYDPAETGAEYAHTDGGAKDPGYLTAAKNASDLSYYDAASKTLHLKGSIQNSSDGKGIVLPDGVKREEIKYIIAEKGTVLPENCSSLCVGMKNLLSANLKNADTSKVRDMSKMFYNCAYLSSIDVSGFNTSKVTDMSGMFGRCGSLRSIDVSGFDTSNVTDMSEMFMLDMRLTSIDVSKFNTSKVTDMNWMFGCTSVYSLDLSNFDTSNVTNMQGMFDHLPKIGVLDLTSFDTSKVTDMRWMFFECYNLEKIKFGSGFDTSNVTNMYGMFAYDHSLRSLDVSGFDTSKVTNMGKMFFYDICLQELDVSNFNTSKVNDMDWMFACCTHLASLDLSSFDTSNVTNMRAMFDHVPKIKTLDLSSFDTRKVTDMRWMFYECYSLETLKLGSNWSVKNTKDGYYMFFDCKKLKGGAGTAYSSNRIGLEYARIDGGKNAPGYGSKG